MKYLNLVAILALLLLAGCGDEDEGAGGGRAPEDVASCLEGLEGKELKVQTNETPGDGAEKIVTFEEGALLGAISFFKDDVAATGGLTAAESQVELTEGKAVRKELAVVAFFRTPDPPDEKLVLDCVSG